MKQSFFILSLLFFPLTVTFGQADYYPTKVGSVWHFEFQPYPDLPTFEASQTINEISKDCCSQGDAYSLSGLRPMGLTNPVIKANGVDISDSCQTDQVVYYKKQYANTGTLSNFMYFSSPAVRTVTFAGAVSVPAGVFQNCYKITTIVDNTSNTTSFYEYMAPNVGLIKFDAYADLFTGQQIYVLNMELTSYSIPGNNVSGVFNISHNYKPNLLNYESVKEITPSTPQADAYFSVCADSANASVFVLEKVGTNGMDFQNITLEVDPDSTLNGSFTLLSSTATEAVFEYRHPSKIPNNGVLYDSINVYINYAGDQIECLPIRIYRPPVILIHGLKSDSETFSNMAATLINPAARRYQTSQVLAFDYRHTNVHSFETNRYRLRIAIDDVLAQLRTNMKCVAGKVDVVGHSMGGLLSRIYIQSATYKNDVHKLITLNTPHWGSPAANFLVQQLGCDYYKLFYPVPNCQENAIIDLQTISAPLFYMNNSVNPNIKVPSHAIGTISSYSNFVSYNSPALHQFETSYVSALINSVNNGNPVFDLFDGENNDLVVSLSSQLGGLPSANTSVFQSQWHGSTKNQQVINRVIQLLNAPGNGNLFSKYKFKGPGQNAVQEPSENMDASNSVASIHIQAPANNAGYPVNANFTISLQTTGPIHKIAVVVGYDDSSVLFGKQHAGSNQFQVDTFFSQPGLKHVMAIGLDTLSGIYYFDTIQVQIGTNLPFISQIRVEPNQLFLPLGNSKPVKVLGVTASGELDITAVSGLVYYFANNRAARINNEVQGLVLGNDVLTVQYNNLFSNQVSIQIVTSETDNCLDFQPQVVVQGPTEICSGEQTLIIATGGNSYQWSNGSSASQIVVSTPGNYFVTVSDIAGCIAVLHQEIGQSSSLPISANFSQSISGTTVTFSNTTPPVPGLNYNWDFGDGATSTLANPTHTYVTGGFYTVILTAYTDCSSGTKSKLINTAPTANFTGEPQAGCASLVVSFENQSSNNAVSYQWSFPGGIPSNSFQINPTVVYTVPGVYTVNLTATNSSGSQTTVKTSYIYVQSLANAQFTWSATGLTATFFNLTVDGDSYLWDFGDGTTSTLANPVHTYAATGSYQVKLVATNECGSTTVTKTVSNLIAPPVASFTTTPATTGCPPHGVLYSNTSSGSNNSYQWLFPGGSPSSSTNQLVVVYYNTPGHYDATLIVTNPGGSDTLLKEDLIHIQTPPLAGFSFDIDGAEVSFQPTFVLEPVNYLWSFGDGVTSTEKAPVHAYAADGDYAVTLTVSNACGTVSSTQPVQIQTAVPSALFIADQTTGCQPLVVHFENFSTGNYTTIAWEFSEGMPFTSNEPNPVVTFETPGVHFAQLTVSNTSGAFSTYTELIWVDPVPVAQFTSISQGGVVTFENQSQYASDFVWYFDDGTTSTAQDPIHYYTIEGLYEVTLVASNACGGDTITIPVVVQGVAPGAQFSNSIGQSGCIPFSTTFMDQSTGNPTSWHWFFEGGNPSESFEQNPFITYYEPGSHGVYLEVSNAYGTSTVLNPDYLMLESAPISQWTFTNLGSELVAFSNLSQMASSYIWNFGDGTTSTETYPVHQFEQPGEYQVSLTAFNNCGASTMEQIVQVQVQVSGVSEINQSGKLRIFPNPGSGLCTVEPGIQEMETYILSMRNMQGMEVLRETIRATASFSLDARYLPNGVYQVNLVTGKGDVLRDMMVIQR
ncbi:MAG: alpha/beta fold hydrolase [Saprospiraceae bacterium]|nr:alpha/beta fold hydrolase [Saprospiraceae bacterium]